MTCIKTGAIVYFMNYDVVAPADIYQVGNARVVRTPQTLGEYQNAPLDLKPTHAIHSTGIVEFWRPDLGVFVVPEDLVWEVES